MPHLMSARNAFFFEEGFGNHRYIFPIINFHIFQSMASKTQVDKSISDMQKEIKQLCTSCNQIDKLQLKVQNINGKHSTKEGGGKDVTFKDS